MSLKFSKLTSSCKKKKLSILEIALLANCLIYALSTILIKTFFFFFPAKISLLELLPKVLPYSI